MPRQTPFSVGRRWRFKEMTKRHPFPTACYFVVIGPGMRTGYKRCRIEYEGHTGPCGQFCHHGMEQDYGHRHLKKYATLVEEE